MSRQSRFRFLAEYQEQRAAQAQATPAKANTRPLGREQAGVLRALVEHKAWYGGGFGCGWNWGTPANTERICETLVRRGLVAKVDEPGLSLREGALRTVYRATPAGEALVAANKAAAAKVVR